MKYRTVTILFLILGHTNNRLHCAFWLVKKRLKKRDVNFPSEMMPCMEDYLTSFSVTCWSDAQLFDWKAVLNAHFIVQVKIKINSCYIFQACRSRPGVLFVQQYSPFTDRIDFNMLRAGVTRNDVISATTAALSNDHS